MIRSALFSILAFGLAAPGFATNVDTAQEREVKSLKKELAKLEKRYDKLLGKCRGDSRNRADARACDTARVTYLDVQELKKRISALSVESGA